MNRLVTCLLFIIVISCKEKAIDNHCVYSEVESDICNCKAQFEIGDSSELTHVKNQFYRSRTGHLYEKTFRLESVIGATDLVDVKYFNGYFSQEVDPLSFEINNGIWGYAKDKHYVYYCTPTSGGLQIKLVKESDIKTFVEIKGEGSYAKDKKYFYQEGSVIDSIDMLSFKKVFNKSGNVIELVDVSSDKLD